jgi:hypothetical protein
LILEEAVSTVIGGADMSREEHLQVLKEKHAGLEDLIRQEEMRPLPDTGLITQMKRQKLRLKDEMMELAETQTRH